MSKRDQVLEAVKAIGRPCTERQIREWLETYRPGVPRTDVRNALSALTINDTNRHHNGDKRADPTPDPNNPKDALIKIRVRGGRNVRYWLYDFATGEPTPFAAHADPGPSAADVAASLDPTARYWQVWEAVKALGRPASIPEITTWLEAHHPEVRHPDVRQNAGMLTVNEPTRPQFDGTRHNYRTDRGHPKDLLFRRGDAKTGVTYEPYNVTEHGVWDLRPDAEGKWRLVRLDVAQGAAEQALAEARADVAAETTPEFSNEAQARRYEMRAIVMREGQPQFKAALLDAYEGRCAVTGSGVVAILEGAHIHPYCDGGAQTNVVSNGLLLRADIHTLFDRGLLWVDANGCVQLDADLADSEYASLKGRPLREPKNAAARPHPAHLAHHRVNVARQPT